MHYLNYHNKELHIEEVSAKTIAKEFGTPCYVYSRSAIEANCLAFENALTNVAHKICYAVKANSNIGILNLFARKKLGFDIVSVGELERVLAAGGDPQKIVFSGVGKKPEEIERALAVNIYCFNVESAPELERIQAVAAKLNKTAHIALRINPNIDAKTHPYIATGLHENKFGIDLSLVLPLCSELKKMPNLKLIGLGCHIGSQIMELDPFVEAVDCLLDLSKKLTEQGIKIKTLNLGGGLGITYHQENPPTIPEYLSSFCNKLSHTDYEIIVEPGRALIGNAGILLTRVEYLKETQHKNFAIVDAGMNDLIRPALYDAWHSIIPVTAHMHLTSKLYDIVGPVCESGDFFGNQRDLSIEPGDLLSICTAGAYAASMSSNYNSRPRAPEILIDGTQCYLLRARESIQDLFMHEKLIQ